MSYPTGPWILAYCLRLHLDLIAAQTGLNRLQSEALFDRLLDDAPPRYEIRLEKADNAGKYMMFRLRPIPLSLLELETYWWEPPS